MKKKIWMMLFLFGAVSQAQEEFPIYNQVSFIDRFEIADASDQHLVIGSPFAKSELEFPDHFEWSDKRVSKVTYYYSKNNNNPSFEQNDLSNRRFMNLISRFPQLGNEEIQWKTIVQSACKTDDCAKGLFHGFIIEFEEPTKLENPVFKPLTGHDQLEIQVFRIDPRKENVIIGEKGTKVLIPPGAFVDGRGGSVDSKITITMKEALNMEDIVFGGLNTITSDGEMLMSKGMVEIRAHKGRHELGLKKNKAITVLIPTKYEDGYSYYAGDEKNSKLSWKDPVPVTNQLSGVRMNENNAKKFGALLRKVRYADPILERDSLVALQLNGHESNGIVTKEDILNNANNAATINKKVKRIIKNWFRENDYDFADLNRTYWYGFEGTWFMIWPVWHKWDGMVWDYSLENPELANVFQMKQLGWANVDCLASNFNTIPTRFNVSIENTEEYQELSMNLIVPRVNCMIPGWQKKDGNWSFTHGEYEDKVPMARGEKVFVMVTGKKNEQHFFNIKEFKLGYNDINPVALNEMSRDEMAKMVKDSF